MLSERIYQLRRARGLSQEQLAERLGVSRQTVSKWETGISTPELEKLMALCDCFDLTLDELVAEDAPRASQEPPGSSAPRTDGGAPSRIGVVLCLVGAVCLILAGIAAIVRPDAAEQLNAASTITLNGSGILLLACVLAMAAGLFLILRKK